jgi:WS/DGAT C-terminal domain
VDGRAAAGRRAQPCPQACADRRRDRRAQEKNARPQITSGIFRFILVQRAFNLLPPHQRYLNIFITNVPGPPAPLYLAGALLLEMFPVLAITGNMALGAAVMSHAGQLNLTAVADRDHCPDAEVFAEVACTRCLTIWRSNQHSPARPMITPPGQPAGEAPARPRCAPSRPPSTRRHLATGNPP